MASHVQDAVGGGRFLTQALGADEVFTREDLSEEQRMFGQTAAEFMRQEVLPSEPRLYAHDWVLTRELIRKAAALDLARLEIPTAYGGLGLDMTSAAYVGEQIAVNPSFAGSLGAHTTIGTLPIVYFGTDEQKARYLPRLGNADLIGAYALTESQSGSDALAARTTARLTPDGRHYALNGQKMWISNGGFADLFTIFAKVDGEKFTAFIVERSMGVVSGREEHKLGLDGSSTTALMLDNVKVPVENVLGTIGEGHKVAFNTLNLGRVKLGTRNITGAKLSLNHAVAYAKERRQFGRAICEFGLIKHKIGEMAVRCYVGDAMVYRVLGDVRRALEAVAPGDTAGALKTIEAFAVECSINKVWTSEALAYAADEAVQVFGGNGYSRSSPSSGPTAMRASPASTRGPTKSTASSSPRACSNGRPRSLRAAVRGRCWPKVTAPCRRTNRWPRNMRCWPRSSASRWRPSGVRRTPTATASRTSRRSTGIRPT